MPLHATTEIDSSAIDDLLTVRDWVRFGASRFAAAGLVFGHGTDNPTDEAAFMVLAALRLPIDVLEPWLEARLTRSERFLVASMFERRMQTRKPAAYILGEAWIGSHRFYVDERVIVPRSFIGELLGDGLSPVVPEPEAVTRVLDVCTGSGCLAILAALAFPNARVDACDISREALAVANRNVTDYQLGDRVRLIESDLFAAIGDNRYDLIITNPPYVTNASLRAFPPEYRAEPVIAHLGGEDGMEIVRRILAGAADRLTPNGNLVVEIGLGRTALESTHPNLPYFWLQTAESEDEVFALPATAFSPAAEPPRRARAAPRATKKA